MINLFQIAVIADAPAESVWNLLPVAYGTLLDTSPTFRARSALISDYMILERNDKNYQNTDSYSNADGNLRTV